MNSDLKVIADRKQEKVAAEEKTADQTVAKETSTDESEKDETLEIAHHPGIQEHYLGGEYSSAIIKKIRKDPTAIGKLFKEGKYPYTDRIPRKTYNQEKAKLQIELLKVQNWVKLTGQKIVLIFEGRDAG